MKKSRNKANSCYVFGVTQDVPKKLGMTSMHTLLKFQFQVFPKTGDRKRDDFFNCRLQPNASRVGSTIKVMGSTLSARLDFNPFGS